MACDKWYKQICNKKVMIYTSLIGLKLSKQAIKPYTSLKQEIVEWVDETTIKLLSFRGDAEIKAGDEIKRLFGLVHEQPFFMIKGNMYFLDFYIPQIKTAVEIDGKQHKLSKAYDKQRDMDFNSIGIRTVRFSAKDVYNKGFIEKLKHELYHRKIKKNPLKKTSKRDGLIAKAIKRVKQHNKMKNKAYWI